jgi:hypothetical protein
MKVFLILFITCGYISYPQVTTGDAWDIGAYEVLQAAQVEHVILENIQSRYQDNSLYVTWEVPDSLADIPDWFNIFYCEAPNTHLSLLDSALYWYMDYIECYEWEWQSVWRYEAKIKPQSVYPAYSSMIRIGIMPSIQYGEASIDSFAYGKLFLAPDIYNKTPATPDVGIR